MKALAIPSFLKAKVGLNFALAMHIDTDETNAANIRDGMHGCIEGIQSNPQNS